MSDKRTGKNGKVVLYVTSVQMVRSTRELCKQVLHVLRAYRVKCTVKDVYLHPAYSKELSERLGGAEDVTLPQVRGEMVILHFQAGNTQAERLRYILDGIKLRNTIGLAMRLNFASGVV